MSAATLKEEQIVKSFSRKMGNEEIRVTVKQYKGKTFINLRVWYVDQAGFEFKPTTKGVVFKPDELTELIAALGKAQTLCEE